MRRLALVLAILLLTPRTALADEERIRFAFEGQLTGSVRELLVARVLPTKSSDECKPCPETHAMSTGIPVYSGGLALGVMVPLGTRGGVLVGSHYQYGATEGSLAAHTVFIGGDYLYRVLDPLALFVGPRIGWIGIERATSGPLIQHWNYGLEAGASVEVARWSTLGLFVRPAIDAAIVPHRLFEARSLLWGGNIGIGVRWYQPRS